MSIGIDFGDLCSRAHRHRQLLSELRSRLRCKLICREIFGVAGGDHWLRVALTAIRGQDRNRDRVIFTAQLAHQAVARQSRSNDNNVAALRFALTISAGISVFWQVIFRTGNQLEIIFAYAAVRAGPVVRYILPFCAGCDAVIGPPFFLIVNQSADDAFPSSHVRFSYSICLSTIGAGEDPTPSTIVEFTS